MRDIYESRFIQYGINRSAHSIAITSGSKAIGRIVLKLWEREMIDDDEFVELLDASKDGIEVRSSYRD